MKDAMPVTSPHRSCLGRILALLTFALPMMAGAGELSAPVVTERGPHHRVWTRTTLLSGRDGKPVPQSKSLVELGTAICFSEEGQWVDAKEVIEPAPGGAVAHTGQLKAAFALNLNTRGAIQLVNAEGAKMVSHISGLFYTDLQGKSVLVAALKDSVGEILLPNQIIYRDAFENCRIDVLYTYKLDGFEQDLIVRESPPQPEAFGLNPATTLCQVFTEVLDSPPPKLVSQKLDSLMDRAQQANLPDLMDETVYFPGMHIGPGKAFDIAGENPQVPTAKTWLQVEQRTFLAESVEYPAIQKALAALPKQQARVNANQKQGLVAERNQLAKIIPPVPKRLAAAEKKLMDHTLETASFRQPAGKGFVLDYVLTLNSGLTNHVFRPDITYYINGSVNLYGTNTIRGGTVVKYGPAAGTCLNFSGTVVCDTSPYRPAIFTSANDSTVGDVVGVGPVTNYYTAALKATTAVQGDLHDLRIKYAVRGIHYLNNGTNRFSNIQFLNCSNGIDRMQVTHAQVDNILAKNVGKLFGFWGSLDARHITADGIGTLGNCASINSTLCLTNSILVNVTNLTTGTMTLQADYIATNNCPAISGVPNLFAAGSSPFVAVAGGQYYLANNSPLRNAGTTNLPARLLAELKGLTTYPPLYCTNIINANTVCDINAPRDSAYPDLGWHYTPLDAVVSGLTINTNAALILTNGAAIGVDYGASPWGIIFDTGKLVSQGSALNPNRIVRAHCVQENTSGNPANRAMFYDKDNDGLAHGNSEVRLRFTELSALAQDGNIVSTGKHWSAFEIVHSQLYNTSFSVDASKGSQVYGFTNTLFDSADFIFRDSGSSSVLYLFNNLFRNHELQLLDGNTTWVVRDNLFESSSLNEFGNPVANSHNGYYLTTSNKVWLGTNYLLVSGATDKSLTSLAYEPSPLWPYYQPTSSVLINAGSRSASDAGLYHFTTTINQLKETNSVVDIGLHEVAIDVATGRPVDTDGDGMPDYAEDANGDGLFDEGDPETTDWQIYNSLLGIGASPGLQVFTPLKP